MFALWLTGICLKGTDFGGELSGGKSPGEALKTRCHWLRIYRLTMIILRAGTNGPSLKIADFEK
jgi:hypothetical protein